MLWKFSTKKMQGTLSALGNKCVVLFVSLFVFCFSTLRRKLHIYIAIVMSLVYVVFLPKFIRKMRK